MWAKLFQLAAKFILLPAVKELTAKAYWALKEFLERKKRLKKTQDAARRIEDAKTPSDVAGSIDDLP